MGAHIPMESLTIRIGVPADLEPLVAIDSYATNHPSRVAEIAEWLSSAEVLVAERAGRAVGYAVLNRAFMGQPYMAMLMVAAEARRNGIGMRLVEACRDGRPRLWTSTNESNLPMQALLQRLGFRPAGRIEGLDEGDPELFCLWVR